jgi:hypothetical protein
MSRQTDGQTERKKLGRKKEFRKKKKKQENLVWQTGNGCG